MGAAWSWFASHVLGGLTTSAIMGAAIRLSHVRLKRHITTVTQAQTAELKRDEGGRL